MFKTLLFWSFVVISGTALLLLMTPRPIDAISWSSSESLGYKGVFDENTDLLPLKTLSLGSDYGPEDIAINSRGELFSASASGYVLRYSAAENQMQRWVYTGGYPLGMRFDTSDNLIVADAVLGLLSISPEGIITVLTNSFSGSPLGFTDALTISDDGTIYFTDASTRFSVRDYQTPSLASHYDILESRPNGRVLRYLPQTRETQLVADDIQFANGIVITTDQSALLVNETGRYRVLKISLSEETFGQKTTLIEGLPGFPDNLSKGSDGLFWLGLVAPRSPLVDALSEWPSVRNAIALLPVWLQPKPMAYSHIVSFTSSGEIKKSYQDPLGSIPMTTGAVIEGNTLYVTSLTANVIGIRQLNYKP